MRLEWKEYLVDFARQEAFCRKLTVNPEWCFPTLILSCGQQP